MIEKMKFVTITGAVSELDRIIEQYIAAYDIQLEYASRELYKTDGISSFSDANPYLETYKKAEAFIDPAAMEPLKHSMHKDTACEFIKRASDYLDQKRGDLSQLETKSQEITEIIQTLSPFRSIDFTFEDLKKFKFITYRFGKIPVGGFRQFETFLYDDSDIIFLRGETNDEYVWFLYFTPSSISRKVDSIMSNLHFRPIDMPGAYNGYVFAESPAVIIARLMEMKNEIQSRISGLKSETLEAVGITQAEISAAYTAVKDIYFYYECRKYAAKISNDYFSFVGWMVERDAVKLKDEMEKDDDVVILLEDINESIISKPPTKLRNLALFRPFEFFVRMYGVPEYNEFDPTPFVAITYSLFFGMMFGDVGQGAVLSLIGFLLKRLKNMALGPIIMIVGLFSMFFGFLYGSVFGIESDDVLPAVFLRPSHNITQILVVAVVFGALVIVMSMFINMANALKANDKGRLLFGANGLAGLLFYLAIIFCVALAIIYQVKIAVGVVLILTVPLLIAIAFKEPLSGLIQKRKHADDKHKSMALFILESVMELIEVLLGYFTNTVSFVRVGGFAISHAGLMSAVMILSGMDSGSPNIPIVIFGNAFVMLLEGVVVGIQVLRLQFYEMFSRYYTGSGTEFVSYRSLKKR